MNRVEKISLNNFRVFKGEKNFDFISKRTGEAADLVMIYAPNGTGKTSIFDSVEWALTGKIHRLENLGNKEFEGPILKNFDAETDCVRAELFIQDNQKVSREFNRQIIKKDYTPGSLSGTSIKDDIQEYDHWLGKILPHDRIDGFISAKSPAALYSQWSGLWDSDGEATKTFNFITELKKVAEKQVNSFEKRLVELEERIQETSLTKEDYIFINRKIDEYNSLANENNDLLKDNSDFSGMVNIQHILMSRKDLLTKVHVENQYYIEIIQELLVHNQEYSNNISKLESLNKSLASSDLMINRIQKKNQLNNKIADVKKVISISQEIIREIEIFVDSGNSKLELVLLNQSEMNQLTRVEGMKKDNDNLLKKYSIDLKEFNDSVDTEFLFYNEVPAIKDELLKKAFRCDVIIKQICSDEKELESLNEKLSINRKKHVENQNIISNYDKVLKSIETIRTEESQLLRIPENLKTYTNDTGKVEESYKKYKLLNSKMAQVNDEISDIKKISSQNDEIIINALEVINKSKISVCPVCKTSFDDIEALVKSIKSPLTDLPSVKIKLEESIRIKSDIDIQKKVYFEDLENVALEIQNSKDLVLKDISILISDDLVIKERILEVESLIERSLKDKQIIVNEFVEKNIISDKEIKISNDIVEEWTEKLKAQRNNKIIDIKRSIESTNERIKEGMSRSDRLVKEIESIKDRLLKFEEDLELVKLASMLKQLDFSVKSFADVKREYITKKDIIDLKIKEKETFEDELEKFKDIEDNCLDIERGNRMMLQNEIIIVKKQISDYFDKYFTIIPNKDVSKIDLDSLLIKRKIIKAANENKLEIICILEKVFAKLNFSSLAQKSLDDRDNIKENLLKSGKALAQITASHSKISDAFSKKLSSAFNNEMMNDIFSKIEPHPIFRDIKFNITVNDNKPELNITVGNYKGEERRPEWYFSSAQLNVLGLCVFLSGALKRDDAPINTIFIDDPIGHFDDINIISFIDVLRAIIENNDIQIVMSTHEESIYNLMMMKIPEDIYATKFIDLTQSESD